MKLPWTRFQILASTAALGAFALMIAGGFVTQTGSGLGCPDWPMCHGQVVPDLSDPSTAIEWTHRTVAAVEGVIVIAATLFAWWDRRDEPAILFPATMSLVFVVVQGIVGGATVLSELNPYLVVAHLAFASAFFAMTVATMVLAFALPPHPPGTPRER